MNKKEKEIIAEIKGKLQYPRITLNIIFQMKEEEARVFATEFFEEPLECIHQAVKLLNKLDELE